MFDDAPEAHGHGKILGGGMVGKHASRDAAAADSAASVRKPKLHNPRHLKRTLLYQTMSEFFETWHGLASAGQFNVQGERHAPKPYVGWCLHQIARPYRPGASTTLAPAALVQSTVAHAETAITGHSVLAVTLLGNAVPPHSWTCTSQASTGALPVGGVDRSHLRGVPFAMPKLRWADAPDSLYHRGTTDWEERNPPPDFGADQRIRRISW